ncbi:MAG TPA: peptidyl-prolyl cis-trans isomerase [Thiolinea sp.]|nr:peptidyl-prolyl cis-trans isomerase [Thiolinea sp.]
MIKPVCFWGAILLSAPVLSFADAMTLDNDTIASGIAAQDLRIGLDSNFTPYLGKLLANPAERKDFIRQFYAFHALEQRAGQLTLAELEQVKAELALRRSEILRDAVIKHELEARDLDIEALARERYTVNKEKYQTRRRIKIAQIFMAKKDGQEAEVRQKMEGLLKQLEDDNLRHYQETEARQAAEAEQVTEKQKPGQADSGKVDATATPSDERAGPSPDVATDTTEDNKKTETDLFAELATQYSEGANAPLGGFDSRWLLQPTKEMNDPVIKAAFELLRRGEITGVIDGKNGYHILRLMDYVPNRQQTFDEVKGAIMSSIKESLWREKSKELAQELQAPKDMAINDELAKKIITEVYDRRDPSLKQQPAAVESRTDAESEVSELAIDRGS